MKMLMNVLAKPEGEILGIVYWDMFSDRLSTDGLPEPKYAVILEELAQLDIVALSMAC